MWPTIESAALELIRRAVEPVGTLVAGPRESRGSAKRPDAEIRFANGRRAALDLKRWGARLPDRPRSDAAIVWILERSVPELRHRLRDADENFVDLSGQVRLHLRGLLIDRTDLEPAPRFRQTETRNPFADRASRIPRTLFAAPPEQNWSIQELSETTGVSLGATSYVVNALAERELVHVSSVGREKRVRLADRRSLVLHWTAEYTWRRNTSIGFDTPMGNPSRFLRRVPEALKNVRWALGMQAGASLRVPHAKWDIAHIYVDESEPARLRAIGSRAAWSPAETGKVVLLAPYYASSVWYGSRDVQGLPVVSDLQLILDLWHYPNRGREQAEVLLDRFTLSRR